MFNIFEVCNLYLGKAMSKCTIAVWSSFALSVFVTITN